MPRNVQRQPISKRRRFLRLIACVAIGLILTVPLYVGLVKTGLVRSPFSPRLEGDIALARSERAGLRVLFVGNSFTFYNSMPALVHGLAEADDGARPLFAVEYTAPNWNLQKASRNDGLVDVLGEARWDYVVLQDNSQFLALGPDWRRREVYPFARELQREVALAGSHTVLFMTWGYKKGDSRNFPGDTFEAMQGRLQEGYADLGAELFAPVVPVGLAWAEALRRQPGLDLWAGDGRHPNASGSYLAACVFYAMLADRDPTGSTFTAGLEPAEARFLQGVASDVARAQENGPARSSSLRLGEEPQVGARS